VRQQVVDRYGYDMLYKGGLQIYTTLNLDMQEAAEQAVEEGLRRFDVEQRQNPPETPTPDEEIPADLFPAPAEEIPKEMVTRSVQGALVAIDPGSGEIRAMIGGRDFESSEFNRAVQARRQPGSGFKPFIWATAIEEGKTPSDKINDAPIIFHYGDKIWKPQNYENKFYGPTTLREALEHSRNIVAIKLLREIGVTPVIRLAHRMGIKSDLPPNLTLSLGSGGVSPMEMTAAFATFASDGIYREPISILKIVGADGEIIEEKQPKERIALSEQNAYIMTSLMQGVILRGTGIEAQALGRPAAGKTGTSNNCSDAWFVGYTPQLVAGVWVGYDDMRSLGKRETGGHVATPIWTSFMKEALAKEPVESFAIPPGIQFVSVEPGSGLLAPPGDSNTISQAFKEGTAPTRQYDPAEAERMTDDIMHIFPTDLPL
jgi:penicillin-binding protein 1A